MRTYTKELPNYVQQGTYTETYHAKKWDDLTAEQKEEILEHAMRDGNLEEWYYEDERNLYFDMIENLKQEYKNVYDNIHVYWQSNSQGPYLTSKWELELHDKPSEIVDLSDVGIVGPIEVTILDVLPSYSEVNPVSDDFELYFDYNEDEVTFPEDFDYYFEEYMDESKNGRAFLEKYAKFYSEPIEKYWEEINNYTIGYNDYDEWVRIQLDEGGLTAIYVVTDDGEEEFEEFEWE